MPRHWIIRLFWILTSFGLGVFLTGWLLISFYEQQILDVKIRDTTAFANVLQESGKEEALKYVRGVIPYDSCELIYLSENNYLFFIPKQALDETLEGAFQLVSINKDERDKYCDGFSAPIFEDQEVIVKSDN